jgi:ATP-binding cassette subfamily F protein uup
LIVSHDRAFIDNTVTSSWWFAGNGQWSEYVGGYQDAISQGAKFYSEEPVAATVVQTTPVVETKPVKAPEKPTKKLSYKLQKELDALPSQMEQLEQEIETLQQQISNADFYSQPADTVSKTLKSLAEKEQNLELCFQRWEELESQK